MHTPRSIVLMIVGMFVFVGVLTTQSYAEIDSKTVVGLWMFDGDEDDVVRDSSENNLNGIIKGDPEWTEGKFGKALEFDGDGDFVDCGSDESLNLEIFTVTFWFKMPATQGWNHMVSKGSHVASGTPGSVNWGIISRSNEAGIKYEIYQDTSWTGVSVTPISLDEWHHVAATYDGENMVLYFDGESKGNTLANIKLDESRSFRIGGIATADETSGSFFNGSLDEVGFFNAVLAVDDIQTIMNKGLEETLGITAVSPASKLATTWAGVKTLY